MKEVTFRDYVCVTTYPVGKYNYITMEDVEVDDTIVSKLAQATDYDEIIELATALVQDTKKMKKAREHEKQIAIVSKLLDELITGDCFIFSTLENYIAIFTGGCDTGAIITALKRAIENGTIIKEKRRLDDKTTMVYRKV